MKVEKGKRVRMEYQLAVDGGDVIESSARQGPLEYIHGSGKMLPGLESRIEGLEVGDEKEGVIPAKEAYGLEEDLPTTELTAADFPADEEPEEGKRYQAKGPEGNDVTFVVEKIDGDKVTIRFLHPLVGKDLRFKVKILEISDPN